MASMLPRAVHSAFRQTHPPIEIIVVDDGSTDDTQEVLARLADEVPILRFTRQENAGNAAAKNTGVAMSEGQWIGLLDADDVWTPDRLQRQIDLIKENPTLRWAAGAYTRVTYGDDDSRNEIDRSTLSQNIVEGGDGSYDALEMIVGETSLWIGTVLAHRDLFDRLGVFNDQLKGCDDSELWLRFALCYSDIGFVSTPIADYTVAQGQSLTGVAARRVEPSQFLHYELLKRIAEESPGDVREKVLTVLNRKINGSMSALIRTGSTWEARKFLRELRSRSLPTPKLTWRLFAGLPQSIMRRIVPFIKSLRYYMTESAK